MRIRTNYLQKELLIILSLFSFSLVYAQVDTINLEEYGKLEEFNIPFTTSTLKATNAPVTVISGEDIERMPTNNLTESLTGKIPNGLFFTASNKAGSSKAGMRIRGFNYLVLIDGVPRPLDELSTYEIESVNVLRGLSATALYGSDARNGIIYVQTKRGSIDKSHFNVDFEYGISSVNQVFQPEWLDAYNYGSLYNEARKNDGLADFYTPQALTAYQDGSEPLRYPDEDLYEMIFNNSMSFRRANISYSGGKNTAKYFVNLNYKGEGNNLYKINSLTSDNLGIRSNLEFEINKYLNVNVGVKGNLHILKEPNVEDEIWPVISNSISSSDEHGIWNVLGTYPPNAYPVNIVPDTFGISQNYGINPVGDLTNHLQTTQYNSAGQFNVGLNFDFSSWVKGLTFSTLIAYDITSISAFSQRPGLTYTLYEPLFIGDEAVPYDYKTYGLNYASSGITQVISDYSTRLYNYYYLSYMRGFGNHSLKIALANTFNFYSYRLPAAAYQDLKKQDLGLSLNYSYRQKYYADLILSYSGIMNLPTENRFDLFPTVGLGWVVSEESFMSGVSLIDHFKIRASYGKVGSWDSDQLFIYKTYWNAGGWASFNNRAENNNSRYRGTLLTNLGNAATDWGVQNELNAGFDLMLLKRKLGLRFDYYDITREKILMSSPVPAIIGNQTFQENIGSNNYSGIDLQISFTNENANNLIYSLGLNGGYGVLEVLLTNEIDFPYPWMGTKGNPTDAIYGLVAEGLLTENDIANGPVQGFGQVLPGNIKYSDLNEDGLVQSEVDEQMIGNNTPRINYGVDIDLRYKGVGLYVLGYGLAGFDVNMRTNTYYYGYGDRKYSAYTMENRWTEENPETDALHPRLTTGNNSNDNRNSTYWLADASFFKIKNIELAYHFSEQLVEKMHMAKLKLFVRGTNLFTVTKFEGMDPENIALGVSTYPSMRTFTGGFSMSF